MSLHIIISRLTQPDVTMGARACNAIHQSHILVNMRFSFINKKQKIFSEKQKGFRDGLSYPTPQKSQETRGNVITQPRSHPIKKNVESTLTVLLVMSSWLKSGTLFISSLASESFSRGYINMEFGRKLRVIFFCEKWATVFMLIQQ